MSNPNPSVKTRFKKGVSGNPKGRTKVFDPVRLLAQQIAEEPVIQGDQRLTRLESLLRGLATSPDTKAQLAFLEHAYGKPPPAITGFTLPEDKPQQALQAAVVSGAVSPAQVQAWLRLQLLEAAKGSMTHAEFVAWLRQEVDLDPPVSEPYREVIE